VHARPQRPGIERSIFQIRRGIGQTLCGPGACATVLQVLRVLSVHGKCHSRAMNQLLMSCGISVASFRPSFSPCVSVLPSILFHSIPFHSIPFTVLRCALQNDARKKQASAVASPPSAASVAINESRAKLQVAAALQSTDSNVLLVAAPTLFISAQASVNECLATLKAACDTTWSLTDRAKVLLDACPTQEPTPTRQQIFQTAFVYSVLFAVHVRFQRHSISQ
jgi:hypothetical protein